MLISSVLFFILGVAVTCLVLILAGPSLWRRALYLARQSLATEVPISLSEVQSDRDFLRARHAFEIVRAREKYDWLMEHYNSQKLELDRAKEHLHRMSIVEKRTKTLEDDLVQTRSDLDIERKLLKALESNNGREVEELRDFIFKETPVSVDVATHEAELKKLQTEIIDIKQEAAKAAMKLMENSKIVKLGRGTVSKIREEVSDIAALFTAQTAINEGEKSPIHHIVQKAAVNSGKKHNLAAKIIDKTKMLKPKVDNKVTKKPRNKMVAKSQKS